MPSDARQQALWSVPPAAPGPVRMALDDRVATAQAAGIQADAAVLAVAVELADQIDALSRQLRLPDARPYDRVPLTQLARAYTELLPQLLPPMGVQDDALRDIAAAIATASDWPA